MPTHEHLPTHPVTGLTALGMTRRGPVWPVMGGDGTGDGSTGQDGNAGGDGSNAGGDGGQTNDGDANGQQGGQEPPTGPDGQPLDPARLQRLVDNLRAENAALKGKQQGTGQAPAPQQPQQGQQQAGQGPATNDDGTADKLRAANTRITVLEQAGKHAANPTALTDSMSFMDTVGKLDPDADDYDKQVADAIKKAVADHPHYGTGQAPGTTPRGGSDGTGRPGAPARPKGLDGAVSAHYTKK